MELLLLLHVVLGCVFIVDIYVRLAVAVSNLIFHQICNQGSKLFEMPGHFLGQIVRKIIDWDVKNRINKYLSFRRTAVLLFLCYIYMLVNNINSTGKYYSHRPSEFVTAITMCFHGRVISAETRGAIF